MIQIYASEHIGLMFFSRLPIYDFVVIISPASSSLVIDDPWESFRP